MKKFLVSIAMLSMTALLFTACNKAEEKKEEATPAAAETTVAPTTDAAAKTEDAKTDAAAEVKADVKVEAEKK